MFEGFTQETSDFLWELSFHNERPWFLEHREQFERALNRPFKALAGDCLAGLRERFPDRDFTLHVSRIYRDARRLFGRGPYKDHLWFTIQEGGNYETSPVLWFELHAMSFGCGVGLFDATGAELERFRRTVDADFARFERLAARLARESGLRVIGEEYRRPKRDYPPPVGPWVNRRQLGAELRRDFDPALLGAGYAAELTEFFVRMLPMYDYLLAVHRAAAAAGETRETRRSHGS